MPSIKLTTVGGRAFPVARPTIWNSLPDNVISAPSLSTFHQRLKTFLFQASFPDIIIDPRQIIPLPSVDPEVILLLGPLKKYTIDWWLGMQVWRINSCHDGGSTSKQHRTINQALRHLHLIMKQHLLPLTSSPRLTNPPRWRRLPLPYVLLARAT